MVPIASCLHYSGLIYKNKLVNVNVWKGLAYADLILVISTLTLSLLGANGVIQISYMATNALFGTSVAILFAWLASASYQARGIELDNILCCKIRYFEGARMEHFYERHNVISFLHSR